MRRRASGAPAAAGGVEPANMTPKTTASAVPPAALHPVTSSRAAVARIPAFLGMHRLSLCSGGRSNSSTASLFDCLVTLGSGSLSRDREWPQVL